MATLDDIRLDISVMLGQTTMPVHQLLRMGRGAVIELDASEDDEVTILANSMPVARGAIVVIGNRIAVEVKNILKRPVEMR
jgi:flagellar motor switch protein FliN/FliY